MKQLIEHVKKSIYGPEYYRELEMRPFSFSLKYYSALALFVALLLTIVSSIPLVPEVSRAVREFPEKFFAYYHDQLEVKIEKGIVTSNVSEPYVLPDPAAAGQATGEQGAFLIIDTKTPFSLEQFRAYKTLTWLGEKQIAMDDGGGGVRIVPFTENTTLTINEGTIRGFEQRLRPFYKFIAALVVGVIFLGLLIGFCFNFVYLFFCALLIFLLGRLMKRHWSYGTCYRIGLHAITLPFLIFVVFSLLSFSPIDLPFLYTLIMLGVVYMNFKDVLPPSSAAET